jgi:hypothetical protein
MNAGGMGCLGQILTMLYIPVAFGLFILPLAITGFLRIPLGYGYLVGLVLGGTAALLCAYVPLWLVRRRVELLGQE